MAIDFEKEIKAVEEEIAGLPQGNFVRKKVNGKEYYYRRLKAGDKYVDLSIDPESVETVKAQIARRKQLEKNLKELNALASQDEAVKLREPPVKYQMDVVIGDSLRSIISPVLSFKTRDCIEQIKSFVYGDTFGKVLLLYGLRRTGKSTLMMQTIAGMDSESFKKTAYIRVQLGDTMNNLVDDLNELRQRGFKYIFVDEATFMKDFIDNAGRVSDIHAMCGMKVVFSGSDSLGFNFSSRYGLFGRCILVHTSFIPYREFEFVLGVNGIDEYIRYGGTMSRSGEYYNTEQKIGELTALDEYLDTSIAKNIQHSLENFESGKNFGKLAELHRQGELTSVINRVVEDTNHRFTLDVIRKDFKSHDLSISASELRNDRTDPLDILEYIDENSVNDELRKSLDILNEPERKVPLSEEHVKEIRRYLCILELIYEFDCMHCTITNKAEKSEKEGITLITQPGLRYAQAVALIDALFGDEKFVKSLGEEKTKVKERILNDILGRMMEEVVLLETTYACPDKKVQKYRYDRSGNDAEIDMIVADRNLTACALYEIKHSDKISPAQYKHLMNEEVCGKIESTYGRITGKYVLYRGESAFVDGIDYVNVEEYLKSL
ncbi:MAG: AAA family ATPase [Clostridia bacterium]|nr:AAA family ATPase [Clostridia bacterium]